MDRDPLDRLPLPARVDEVELTAAPPGPGTYASDSAIWALICHQGRPVGVEPLAPPAPGQLLLDAAGWRAIDGIRPLLVADAVAGSAPIDAHPPVSVVVCSRDRADQLTRCLKSLNNLDYPHFEVVVVDNASTDERTKAVTLAAGARYLRENRPGLDFARNAGWRASRFNLVAYTDDDVEVNSNWLRGVASAFTDDTVRAMTGLVIAATMSTEAERCFELGYGGMGKGVRPRRFDPRQLRPADLLGAHHCGVGANMAFRRSTLERLGGFDTALDVGTPSRGGGDLDVFHRTLAAGWVLRYQPTAIVRHHHRQTLAALRRQHADNGRAFGVYLLTILRTGTVGRLATVRYGLGTWFRWLVSRIIGRLRGREPLPMTLLLAELGGALTAPWAYLATHYRDRRLGGRSFS